MQEIGRYGYYRLCAAAERQVSAVTQQKLFCPNSYDSILARCCASRPADLVVSPGIVRTSASGRCDGQLIPRILRSGLGFGVASACVMLGDTLVQSLEPGSFYAPSCTAFSFYVSSALHASLMIALNVALMVIATHGYQRRDPSWVRQLHATRRELPEGGVMQPACIVWPLRTATDAVEACFAGTVRDRRTRARVARYYIECAGKRVRRLTPCALGGHPALNVLSRAYRVARPLLACSCPRARWMIWTVQC